MQTFLDRFKALSVARSSIHPTANDSSNIDPSLFNDNSPSPSASSRGSDRPLVTNVVVKHSSAFSSDRSAGMSKLHQLQFIEMMKGMILDNARLNYPQATYHSLKLIMSRKDKACLAAPNGICDIAGHVATLLAVTEGGNVVLDESEECEYLADAVEDLWEKMMGQTGNVLEGLRKGGGDGRASSHAESSESSGRDGTFVVGEHHDLNSFVRLLEMML